MDDILIYQYTGCPPIIHKIEGAYQLRRGMMKTLGVSEAASTDRVKAAYSRVVGGQKSPEWKKIMSGFAVAFPLIDCGDKKKVKRALHTAWKNLGTRPFRELGDLIESLNDLLVINIDGREPGPLQYHGEHNEGAQWRPYWEFQDKLYRLTKPDPNWFQRSSASP